MRPDLSVFFCFFFKYLNLILHSIIFVFGSMIKTILASFRVMKVAKGFLDQGKKLNFAVANKNMFSHELSEFGLNPSGELPVVAIRTAKGDKYTMTEEFS